MVNPPRKAGTGNGFGPTQCLPPKPSQSPFSVQYHPESSPGPHGSLHLFDRFIALMEEFHG